MINIENDYEDYWDDQSSGWDLYLVAASDIMSGKQVAPTWPIVAETYENAITSYQVLLRMYQEQ